MFGFWEKMYPFSTKYPFSAKIFGSVNQIKHFQKSEQNSKSCLFWKGYALILETGSSAGVSINQNNLCICYFFPVTGLQDGMEFHKNNLKDKGAQAKSTKRKIRFNVFVSNPDWGSLLVYVAYTNISEQMYLRILVLVHKWHCSGSPHKVPKTRVALVKWAILIEWEDNITADPNYTKAPPPFSTSTYPGGAFPPWISLSWFQPEVTAWWSQLFHTILDWTT